ncbi:MAG: UDP-N-acetylmuramate dehydrogenase [Saprospiraceae bacterium]|nr:UDP-N-acetylmuramate dehydrogenase [Saprospiraceae bacterium]
MSVQMHQNVSLRDLNSFGIRAKADHLIYVDTLEKMQEAIAIELAPKMVLGSGSNVLFTKTYRGLILNNQIAGISIVEDKSTYVKVQVGGGVNWHSFVQWAVARDLGGVQNLALIPGTVGAAPIQNIGAYGVEFDSVFVSLEAVDLSTGEVRVFTKRDCAFTYRSSIFKTDRKGQYAVVNITLRLSKHEHVLSLDYGAIQGELEKRKIATPKLADIADVVCCIRQSKLPDPKTIGNAGSFFKNPIIPRSQFAELLVQYPDMVSYPADKRYIKVPAAWLIEHCGWKGYRQGDVGVYEHHALVLVNHGAGSGIAIYNLAKRIQRSVQEVFGIELTPEVNIL